MKPPKPWIDWDAGGRPARVDVGLVDTQASVDAMTVVAPPPTRRRRRYFEDNPLPRGLLFGAMTEAQRAEVRRLRWELKAYSYLSALSRHSLRERQNDRFERVYRKRAKRAARLAHQRYLAFLRAYVESKGGTWT